MAQVTIDYILVPMRISILIQDSWTRIRVQQLLKV